METIFNPGSIELETHVPAACHYSYSNEPASFDWFLDYEDEDHALGSKQRLAPERQQVLNGGTRTCTVEHHSSNVDQSQRYVDDDMLSECAALSIEEELSSRSECGFESEDDLIEVVEISDRFQHMSHIDRGEHARQMTGQPPLDYSQPIPSDEASHIWEEELCDSDELYFSSSQETCTLSCSSSLSAKFDVSSRSEKLLDEAKDAITCLQDCASWSLSEVTKCPDQHDLCSFVFESLTGDNTRTKGAIAAGIDHFCAALVKSISAGGMFSFQVRGRGRESDLEDINWKYVQYPSMSIFDEWKFATWISVVQHVYNGLITDDNSTKRDMYYRNAGLYRSQATVDSIVDDLAATFDIPRSSMNVATGAKGLICGHVVVKTLDGVVIDCSENDQGTLIPALVEVESLDLKGAKWVLVIEKEATFRALAEAAIWKVFADKIGCGILLCGKGYPDVASREFLRLITTESASANPSEIIRLFAFVDLDPHGIDIYNTYKHGSAALKHETARLAVQNLCHLGVKYADLRHLPKSNLDGLLPMTTKDRLKAVSMLSRVKEETVADELKCLLWIGYKAEIQVLGEKLRSHLEVKISYVMKHACEELVEKVADVTQ